MAVSTGSSNKRFYSAINYFDQREIEHNVVDIQNEGEFLQMFKDAGRYAPSAEGDYHHFVNSALFVVGDTTGATVVNNNTAAVTTTLTAGTSGYAMVGTQVLFPSLKVGRISSLSTASSQDTIVINSVDGTNISTTAGDKLAFFSNAQEEESSAPNSNRYDYTKYFNKLQTYRIADVISDVQKVAKIEATINGQDTIMYINHIKKLARLRAEIAASFIAGKMSTSSWSDASPSGLVGANGNSVQTTRGLNDYVTTYGISDSLNTPGTVTTADIQDLVSQLAAARCPDEYMVWLNTASYGIYSQYFKALGSSGVQSGRLSLDGKQLDLNFERISYGGYSFEFSKLKILDHSQLFNFTGSAGIQKNAYFVPKGNVGTEGGGVLPRIRVRYFPQPMEGGMGDSIIRETHQGMLAPTPVGRQANFTCDWYTIQGLEVLGAQHFVKQQVQA